MTGRLLFLCALSMLLGSCDDTARPTLAEREREYCASLDQHTSKLSELARGVDVSNDLQHERWKNAERTEHQKLNATLRDFFAKRPLDKWAVKLDSVRTMNNAMVAAEFRTLCEHQTTLVTVLARNDADVISVLTSAKTDSYALLTGSFQKIAYRNFEDNWWSSFPTYISFALTSIFAVNDDGTTGAEANAKYAPDQASLAAAAAHVAEQDRYRQEQESERRMTRILQRL